MKLAKKIGCGFLFLLAGVFLNLGIFFFTGEYAAGPCGFTPSPGMMVECSSRWGGLPFRFFTYSGFNPAVFILDSLIWTTGILFLFLLLRKIIKRLK